MGILNPVERNSTYLQEIREPEGLAGSVGIVSQSGGLCVSLLTDVSRFGFSHIVSCGNEAVLEAADFLEHLIDDPHTAVIGCFIETVRRRSASPPRSITPPPADKPVVVLKVGRTARARYAVATHTAGEAGDSAVFRHAARPPRDRGHDLAEFTEVLAACQGERCPTDAASASSPPRAASPS